MLTPSHAAIDAAESEPETRFAYRFISLTGKRKYFTRSVLFVRVLIVNHQFGATDHHETML